MKCINECCMHTYVRNLNCKSHYCLEFNCSLKHAGKQLQLMPLKPQRSDYRAFNQTLSTVGHPCYQYSSQVETIVFEKSLRVEVLAWEEVYLVYMNQFTCWFDALKSFSAFQQQA